MDAGKNETAEWIQTIGSNVFDIHNHLLFGVDDGPKSLDASIALAEAAVEQGVTHIAATPHCNDRYAYKPELMHEQISILRERFAGRLTIGTGCEFHLSYDNLESLHQAPSRFTINNKQYLLVEFSDTAIPPVMDDVLYKIQLLGIVPVITHPERNPILIANPSRLAAWLRRGALVQVTAASLLGRFGHRIQVTTEKLIEKNWAHVVASDAHHVIRRPPAMREAYQYLGHKFGQETADRLCVHNPREIFYGNPLGTQPDPLGVDDQLQSGTRGLFRRIFGRRAATE